jgi:hypothetical protein
MVNRKHLSANRLAALDKFWAIAAEKQRRSAIAAALDVEPTNVDRYAGFDNLSALLPAPPVRGTPASRAFELNIARYDTLVSAASDLQAGVVGAPLQAQQHMLQAAIVLGIGAFDAYVRQFTIDAYLALVVDERVEVSERSNKQVAEKFREAIRRAVASDPEIVLDLTRLSPAEAKRRLAEEVFTVQQVRLVTGSFAAAAATLRTVDVDLNAQDQLADHQLIHLAPKVFDSYAGARHQIVHAGVALPHDHAAGQQGPTVPTTNRRCFLDGSCMVS